MKKKRTRTLRFRVGLKGIGPQSRAELRRIGMDEHLSLSVTDVTFTDANNRGFDSSMFAAAVNDMQQELIGESVECRVEEVK